MREWIFRLLAVGLGLAAALVIGELGLRWTTHATRLFEPHPVTGKRFRPDLDVTHVDKESERPVRIRTNSLGYRSPEPTEPAPEGALRLLLLGDSFSAQIQLDEPETLAGRLRRRELCPGRATVVHNFGVDGLHPGHVLKILEGPARDVAADGMVLQLFMSNDVGELAAGLGGGSDLRFALVDGELVEVGGAGSRRRLNAWLNRNSLLYVWQKEKIQALVAGWKAGGSPAPPPPGEAPAPGEAPPSPPSSPEVAPPSAPADPAALHRRAREGGIPDWYWVYLPPDEAWTQGWRAFFAVLDAIHAQARAREIPLVVLQVPNRMAVDPDLYREAGYHRVLPREAFDFEAPARRLREWAEPRGIPLVQPHASFREADADELYFWFGHVTRAGTRRLEAPLVRALTTVCGDGS